MSKYVLCFSLVCILLQACGKNPAANPADESLTSKTKKTTDKSKNIPPKGNNTPNPKAPTPTTAASLFKAIQEKDLASAGKIINDAKADINAKDDLGYTPLHYATLNEQEGVVENLLNTRRE